MTIWKFPINITDRQTVMMPARAKILTVQVQYGAAYLWAQVDEKLVTEEERGIEVFGTGHPMNDEERRYIGSIQLHGGGLVFHIFERL